MTKNITPDYVHQLFCETMGCKMKNQNELTIYAFDDYDYFEKLSEENIEDSISSAFKVFNDSHTEIYINEDYFLENIHVATEIFMAQLIEIYFEDIQYFMNAAYISNRFSKIKKIKNGVPYWYAFCSSFLTNSLAKNIFSDAEDYDNDYVKERAIESLKGIKDDDNYNTTEEKINKIIYSLGMLESAENIVGQDIKNYRQLKKIELTELTGEITGELGLLINNLYRILAMSTFSSLTAMTCYKVNNAVSKISAIL